MFWSTWDALAQSQSCTLWCTGLLRAGTTTSSREEGLIEVRRVLRIAVLCLGIVIIGVLAIPTALLVIPILMVWKLTDKLLEIIG